VTPVDTLAGAIVTTIEGLSGSVSGAVQRAWREIDVPQCGYCQSGQVMSAVALLMENASPDDSEIDSAMSGNVCRCATYHRIRTAIHNAADNLEDRS
jgi:isoquinoline 1-oxidoreductase alpha subunit